MLTSHLESLSVSLGSTPSFQPCTPWKAAGNGQEYRSPPATQETLDAILTQAWLLQALEHTEAHRSSLPPHSHHSTFQMGKWIFEREEERQEREKMTRERPTPQNNVQFMLY